MTARPDPAGEAVPRRLNVETYPTESVRAAMRMVTAAPEDREAARREYSNMLVREAKMMTAYIVAKNMSEVRRHRRPTLMRFWL